VSREYPDRPIVGVGAVIVDGDRVLLVRRANPPLQGEWSVPGGAVEIGETLEAAVAREVLEETGLQIEVGPIVEVLDRIRLDPDGRARYHFVLVDFVCQPNGGALACASDAQDAMWVPLAALTDYSVAAVTIGVIQKGFDLVRSGSWTPREVDGHAE